MITNNFLNETAKALAGESYVTLSYAAFGSSVITPNAASTSLAGEQGSRITMGDSRALNEVSWTGLRTGASVASSTGDTLNSVGFISASTGGTLLSELSLSSIIHTTAFDIAVDYVVRVDRA